MKFSQLNLHPSLKEAIENQGFTDCTPIQEMGIPHILHGRDVAGLAQTGTGKTATYLIPLIERILQNTDTESVTVFKNWKKSEYILVLVPTRELAEQVFQNCQVFCQTNSLKSTTIYGGVSYDPQKQALKKGVQFVIATPGRLIDLYKEHIIDLKQVRAIVFDEADRMFDMGFKDDAKYILRRIPEHRQFLVFSATLNFDVLNMAYQFGSNPIEININKDQAKADHVTDAIFHIGQSEKPKYLLSLLKKHTPHQAIIFSNFKSEIELIVTFLIRNKVPAIGISSLLTQAQRERVIKQFKSDNDQNILVATDVAARGLDIKEVNTVINFDLPEDPENYVHRIGRTGRAGKKGLAFSVVSDRDVESLTRIESYLEHKINTGWMEDADIIEDFKPYPRKSDMKCGPRKSSSHKHSQKKNQRRPTKKSHANSSEHRDLRTGRHKKTRRKKKKSQNSKQTKPQNHKNKIHSQKHSQNKRKKVYKYRAPQKVSNVSPSLPQKIWAFLRKSIYK